jgi:hypothetical protein
VGAEEYQANLGQKKSKARGEDWRWWALSRGLQGQRFSCRCCQGYGGWSPFSLITLSPSCTLIPCLQDVAAGAGRVGSNRGCDGHCTLNKGCIWVLALFTVGTYSSTVVFAALVGVNKGPFITSSLQLAASSMNSLIHVALVSALGLTAACMWMAVPLLDGLFARLFGRRLVLCSNECVYIRLRTAGLVGGRRIAECPLWDVTDASIVGAACFCCVWKVLSMAPVALLQDSRQCYTHAPNLLFSGTEA